MQLSILSVVFACTILVHSAPVPSSGTQKLERNSITTLSAPPNKTNSSATPPPASNNSTDIPGTIDILISDSPSQRVGALTFAPGASNDSYVLDVSNTTVPTEFLLHAESSAPNVPDHPDWTPVSLRIPLNATSSESTDYCAEFLSEPGSKSPVVVRPCLPNWDASSNGSQLFVFDTVTSQISPFWAFINGTTNSSSSATPPSSPPSNVSDAAGAPDGARMMPATLLFKASSPPADSSKVSFTSSLAPSDGAKKTSGPTDSNDDDDDDEDWDDSDNDDDSNKNAGTPFQTLNGDPPPPPPPAPAAPPPTPFTSLDDDPSADPAPAAADPPPPAPADPPTSDAVPGPCATDGDTTCIGDQFAQCDHGAWVLTTCGPGTVCSIVPLWQAPGTVATCDTPEDAAFRNTPEGHRRRSVSGAVAHGGSVTHAASRFFRHVRAAV